MNLQPSMLQAHVSIREKPKNFDVKHEALFKAAFKQEINQVHLFSLKKVTIIKGTIFSLSKLKFYTSLSHIQPISFKKKIKRLFKLFLTSKKIEHGIWICDEWSDGYFHWLTDALSRLIVIQESEFKSPIILPNSYKTKSYIQESLTILGFNVKYYNSGKRLTVERLYTASHTAPTGNYNKWIIDTLRSHFLKGQTTAPFRKIFISRQKANKRKILNEAELIPLLFQNGYELHYFEDYDLSQQIEIMSQCKVLMGLHGAGLTNMLFMPAGGKILELRNEHDTHNNCFFSLASALSHDYYYQLNPGDSADTHNVNITVDYEELKKMLCIIEAMP